MLVLSHLYSRLFFKLQVLIFLRGLLLLQCQLRGSKLPDRTTQTTVLSAVLSPN